MNLTSFIDLIRDRLEAISQALDQLLGSELTTLLTILLGLISLALALLPLFSAARRPPVNTVLPAHETAPVPRNDAGEEIVQLHPECLQTLYGVSPAAPEEMPPVAGTVRPSPEPEPATVSEKRHDHDISLGLIADLSEALSRQQALVDSLTRLGSQQQRQIDLLLAQFKAQSSAFLLQGERLLRLEQQASAQLSASDAAMDPGEGATQETQRLSTFDQAIELAAQGLDVDELMSRCGLSASEARLIVRVHGKPSLA